MRIEIKFKNGKILVIDHDEDTISSDKLKEVMEACHGLKAVEPMIE